MRNDWLPMNGDIIHLGCDASGISLDLLPSRHVISISGFNLSRGLIIEASRNRQGKYCHSIVYLKRNARATEKRQTMQMISSETRQQVNLCNNYTLYSNNYLFCVGV
jgi:hypothetical protein